MKHHLDRTAQYIPSQGARVLDKAKEWLNHEVIEVKQILEEQRDSSILKDWAFDTARFKGFPYLHTMEGKLECAETLLRRINEWENK